MTTSPRSIHAIRIKLRHIEDERYVIVWPKLTEKLCVRLLNPRRTWLTTQAGDHLILKHNGKETREIVESVELYRVHPACDIGLKVTCARDWLYPESNQ